MAEILGLTQVDPLAERYRAAFDKTARAQTLSQTARSEWIDATLELAAVVLEARNQYPDHRDFSRWLGRNDLRILTPSERTALIGFAQDPEAGRKMLQGSTRYSWRGVWEKTPKRGNVTLPAHGKGDISRGKRASGHRQRQRGARIPDVMQDKPRPLEVVRIKGLTREEVDPDFQGTAVEFATKYGHVNLHTKAELEESKRQEALQKWLGGIASHVRTAEAMPAPPDPETLAAWLKTPSKAAKLRAWQETLMRAARLQPAPACDINSPEVMARMDAELECAIPIAREPRLL